MNQEDVMTGSDFSIEDSREEISSLPDENNVTSIMPLHVSLPIGRSQETRLVNLTTKFRKALAYSCSHLVIVCHYDIPEYRFLYGHKNTITSLSSDGNGDLLVSSDSGPENSIIVWKTENFLSAYTFHPSSRTYMTQISPGGEYIMSLSTDEKHTVCSLWVLSNERKDPDGIYMFDVNLGRVNDVAFSLNASTDFMLTTRKTVLFLKWNYNSLNPTDPEVCIPPPLPRKYRDQLSESLYLKGSSQSITSTSDGHILVWNDNTRTLWNRGNSSRFCKKYLEKWFHLQKDGITCLNHVDTFVVTGDYLGTIRFYNHMLFLIHWIQYPGMPTNLMQVEVYLQESPMDQKEKNESSLYVSGSISERTRYSRDFGDTDDKHPRDSEASSTNISQAFPVENFHMKVFSPPKDFLIVDGHGCAYLIDAVNKKPHILLEAQEDVITSIDVHPESDKISMGDEGGHLTLINYTNCQFTYIKSVTDFLSTGERFITCIKYTSLGNHIAIGMKSGELFFVDSCLYLQKQKKAFHYSSTPITKICFSPDDSFMAHTDEQNTVTLYGSTVDTVSEGEGPQWIFCGRVCPHYGTINCLAFDPFPDQTNRLLSVGNDYCLVEYFLEFRKKDGLGILTRNRIEQSAYPLHITWSFNSSGERCLLITNSEFKCKLYTLRTKEYSRTFRGIVCDSPISYCQMLPGPNLEEVPSAAFAIFSTATMIGLLKLPLDGNPYKAMGVVAHPVKLAAVVVSKDNKAVFTLGKNEKCVLKWITNDSALETLHSEGGDGLEPYYSLMDGGSNGWLFRQAVDYFYLAQLLHDGHLWKDEHVITCVIKTCELPHVMRSLGYFATNYEIQSMLHEVFNESSALSKREMDEIEFEEFIRLFLNHRSAKGITSEDMTIHFKVLSEGRMTIPKEKLMHILTHNGEKMSNDELTICINILLQDEEEKDSPDGRTLQLPEELTQNIIEDALLGIKNIEGR